MDDKTAIDWLSRAAAALGEDAELACDHAIGAIETLAKLRAEVSRLCDEADDGDDARIDVDLVRGLLEVKS